MLVAGCCIGFNILKEQFEIKPQLCKPYYFASTIGFNILKEQFEIKPQLFASTSFSSNYWF